MNQKSCYRKTGICIGVILWIVWETIIPLSAQVSQVDAPAVVLPPEAICQFYTAPYQGKNTLYLDRQTPAANKQATATFSVTYTGFTPDAQAAFQRAVDTWAALLTSPAEIRVDASFAPLPTNVLGSAGPAGAWFFGSTLPGVRLIIGRPLADALTGSDLNPGAPDILATFSSTFTNWHFGIGPPPSGQFDFESVVLHELTHGLNFTRFARYDNGIGPAECNGIAGHGCMDIFGDPSFLDYGINDAFFVDGSSVLLRNTTTYPDPSAALGSALVSSAVSFSGPQATTFNFGTPPRLYAPATFAAGSSLSHLDEATFNGTLNALMTPFIAPGEMIRIPGSVTCAIFSDLGWVVNLGNCNTPLPVELTVFEGEADGDRVQLHWRTASETNNAGFEVQQKAGETWHALGFVAGAGTTEIPQTYQYRLDDLLPGTHRFRLKQMDYDGTFEYSPQVDIAIALSESFLMTSPYPNPSNPETQFSLMVKRRQEVQVSVYDLLGQRVAVLFDGLMEAEQAKTFRFSASHLPSATYFIRAEGETFSTAHPVVLLK